MVRLTLILHTWDTSIDRQSVSVHHSVPVGGLERELIALPSPLLLVRRLGASVADLATSLASPLLGDFERLGRVTGSLLVIVHRRGEFHAVDACGRVSMSGLSAVMVPLYSYRSTSSCTPLLPLSALAMHS